MFFLHISKIVEGRTAFEDLLQQAPFLIPVDERVQIFENLMREDRQRHQGDRRPALRFRVRRNYLFEDALIAMKTLPNPRGRLAVVFVDQHGREEVGQDIGGLFKDLWTALSALIFNPDYGLLTARRNEDGSS